MSDDLSTVWPGVAAGVAAAIALFFGVRWLAHYSDQQYGHPVFFNWINLLLLAAWGLVAWVIMGAEAYQGLWLLASVLLALLALAYNVMRTNVAIGPLVTVIQGLAVVPVAAYVVVVVLPLTALLFVIKIVDPKQFELVPPDTAHNRRLDRMYGEMRAKNRQHR